ncbi:glycosyl transferase [Salinarimonas sp.]|uniref:glycosyl transferase n=1 Tax=Salinarimonas sp. TaxID=2766526 RepID=UPI00391DECD6
MHAVLAVVLAAAISAGAILALFPLMRRYALARPNARSSHREPTPQGGGIAVVLATLLVATGLGAVVAPDGVLGAPFLVLVAATIALACIGAVDDIRPLPVVPRLTAQAIAVAASVAAAASEARVLGDGFGLPVPPGVEIVLGTLAGLWFVNLVNFMDGLDWITCAAMVPIVLALGLFSLAGALDPLPGLLAFALAGALLGFAPFNKPVARLFLGDVGSLPIGLLVAWLLYALASGGHVAAAIVLPLYHCADATLTLLRRLARGERVWEAHRTHFYQRATDNGHSPLAVSTTVFGLGIALALIAAATIAWPGLATDLVALLAAGALVAACLAFFARKRVPATSP